MGTLTSLVITPAGTVTPGTPLTATFTGTGLDATGTLSGTLSGGATVSEQITVDELTITDSTGRAWTPVSNNGTTAVFSALA